MQCCQYGFFEYGFKKFTGYVLYFLGPPIPGSPKASIRFYAVLPVGILGFPNASFRFYAVLPIGIFRVRYRFYILFNLVPLSLRFLGSPAHPSSFYAVLPIGIFRIGTQGIYSLFVTFSIDFCLKSSFSDLFLFIGHPIPGFPSASIGFYAVLPIGIFRIKIQEVYSLFVIFSRSSDSWLH